MNTRIAFEAGLLAVVALSCWIGVLGMWRMRQPMQALHFLGVPASIGTLALSIAVFLAAGATQAFWKTALISVILFGINSVVAHATARAFRVRELGHWEPLDIDNIEFVSKTDLK